MDEVNSLPRDYTLVLDGPLGWTGIIFSKKNRIILMGNEVTVQLVL